MPNEEKTPNEQQRKAIEHTEGPIRVFAGPGSGKTYVLTERIARLIESGVSPENIMAFTFTRKAAGELKRRLRKLVGNDEVQASTIHSFCLKMLKLHYDRIGGNNDFELADELKQHDILKGLPACDILPGNDLDRELRKRSLEIQNYKVKHRNIFTHTQSWIQNWYRPYQIQLSRYKMLDFADLLDKTVRLFEECPDLLAEVNDEIRFLHVDEYQDTNRLQEKLARQLAGPNDSIFVVGDDDQSIYGFHGAQPNNIRKFERHYPNARTVTLTQNYRSTKSILNAAVSMIKNNKDRVSKNLITKKNQGGKVIISRCDTFFAESRTIAERIKILVALGYKYSDIAVLYRNRWLAKNMQGALYQNEIPYNVRQTEILGRPELLGWGAMDNENGANEVTLSTIHGAKGLEFRAVFLYALKDAIIPDPRNDIEEERRLFYVGMTRAKEVLCLSYAERHKGAGKYPSRFLYEIPDHLAMWKRVLG